MKKEIIESTKENRGQLFHTISVESSYFEFKDANEHDAITFLARTTGEWSGEKINDLDYAVECSTNDAREFAQYILDLCNQIENTK